MSRVIFYTSSEYRLMKNSYKNCQSCGMPFKKDVNREGSNLDGSVSYTYCSHCFSNGQFTDPELDLSGMKQLVKSKLKEVGVPSFLTGLFTSKLKKLKRWQ